MEEELKIHRQIEDLIRKSQDHLLMEIIPSDCNCQSAKTKKVFRCPEAFEINVLLSALLRVRNG